MGNITLRMTQRILTATVIAAGFVFFAPQIVNAQVYAQPYSVQYNPAFQTQQNFQYQNNTQQINYLLGVLAQLQQQLLALRTQAVQPVPNQPVNYIPFVGQVYGNPFGQGGFGSRIEVTTTGPTSIDSEDVTLNGTIRTTGNSQSLEWFFEYGEDRDFDERTSTRRETIRGTESVDAEIDDIDLDEFVYYRLVVVLPDGQRVVGNQQAFRIQARGSRGSSDDEPDLETLSARDIEDDKAELRGEVDMNDFRNGLVFFVYGEDEREIEDVEDEDEYRDIRERGDDLRKVLMERDLDGSATYRYRVTNLDDDTDYFFRICVEYEDEDDDLTLECGNVREFTTDN